MNTRSRLVTQTIILALVACTSGGRSRDVSSPHRQSQIHRSQVYDMRELSTEQIRSLDLRRTVVLVTAGILEQHGPYLPSYTDGYVNEFLVREIAKAVGTKPGWTVLI